jgi:hypothetical protein
MLRTLAMSSGGYTRDRQDRSQRMERSDRSERMERSDRSERMERSDRSDRDRPERQERSDRPERSDRQDRRGSSQRRSFAPRKPAAAFESEVQNSTHARERPHVQSYLDSGASVVVLQTGDSLCVDAA